MTFVLKDNRRDTDKEFDTRAKAEEKKQEMIGLGGNPEDFEIVNETSLVENDESTEAEPVEPTEDIPEAPGVGTDPLDWVPSDFIDHIDGQPAINRKGYDVLAHHYNISVQTRVMVSPSENGFEYAEVMATAETEDGVTYRAHGSAHVDRGDDSYLLLEMADTRAAKRATARATGVGMVAVEELQNDL